MKLHLIFLGYCRREDAINLKNARICSIHFQESCFEISLKHRLVQYNHSNYLTLKSDAVPTINIPRPQKRTDESKRTARMKKRLHKKIVSDMIKQLDHTMTEIPTPHSETEDAEAHGGNNAIMANVRHNRKNHLRRPSVWK